MQVKDAVETAKNYVLELFGADGLAGLRLEEVERGDDGVWNVTVGFARPMALAEDGAATTAAQRMLPDLPAAFRPLGPRTYRVVRVRDGDGEVLSVKIREGLS